MHITPVVPAPPPQTAFALPVPLAPPALLRPPVASRSTFLRPVVPRGPRRCGDNRGGVPPHVLRSPPRRRYAWMGAGRAAPAAAPAQVVTRSAVSVLSSVVGVFVLIGSVLYKIPQVLRIATHRSGEGVSVAMYSLEVIGTTFSSLYFFRKGFPFSTYGELVFVSAQNVVILGLIVLFERLNRPLAAALAALYIIGVAVLLSPSIPLKVLMFLQISAIPILNLARVPQILLNLRRKGTGQLAPVTLGLQVIGNVARIFTTIASVRDWLMLTGVCVSTLFNTILLLQWVFYNRGLSPAQTAKVAES